MASAPSRVMGTHFSGTPLDYDTQNLNYSFVGGIIINLVESHPTQEKNLCNDLLPVQYTELTHQLRLLLVPSFPGTDQLIRYGQKGRSRDRRDGAGTGGTEQGRKGRSRDGRDGAGTGGTEQGRIFYGFV